MRPDDLRVLQLIPVLRPGGLERVATSLALELAARTRRVVVCSAGGEPHESELRDGGVAVERIPRPWARPVPLARAAFAVARVVRRERPHVIHAHNPGATAAAALARLLARRRRTAVVATYHGVVEGRLPRAARALRLTADVVVGVAPGSSEGLVEAGLPAGRVRTIMNAVDPRPARTAGEVRREFGAENVPLVVTVGRYVAEKNQALLLEATRRLVRSGRSVRVLLVGYGPLEASLRERVAELGLDEVVTVTGERSDAADLIGAADAFALTSDSEALPLVVLEAMRLGTPIVATEVGAIRDVVEPEESALLVPAGDAERLAAALERLLDDAPLRTRLAGGAARAAAERLSVAAMAGAYLDAYLAAIARRH